MKALFTISLALLLLANVSWSQSIQESHKKQYDEIELFDMYHDGWAMVKKGKHLGFIDYNGKEVVPLEYQNADDAIKWYNNRKNK
jgi:hypothetical protein